jgi:hypothetical protein
VTRGPFGYPWGMDEGEENPAPPAQTRPLRGWVLLLIIGASLAVLVPVYILPTWRKIAAGRNRMNTLAAKLEDMNRLRNIAGLCVCKMMDGEDMPLAPDGRVDVYGILVESGAETVEACFSARAGKGPTKAECEAGDYTNFPYQRRRGLPDPKGGTHTPLLWERSPIDGERLVGMCDGSVEMCQEEWVRKFFRANPGQE